VGEYSRQEAAARAGVSPDLIGQLVELGILSPAEGDRYSAGDVRRAAFVQSFAAAGISLEGLAEEIRNGDMSLAFLDAATFDTFTTFTGTTFADLSSRSGIPVELLMVIREAIGGALPTPDDPVREDEMAIVPLIEAQVQAGVSNATIERALRATGDSMQRVVEVWADWFLREVIEPRSVGKTGAQITEIGHPIAGAVPAAE
jgi:hypothetical protein